ncbi:Uncharacterized protein SCF082_LOCUS7411 [Durusdinium trenchii]|uniref:ZZ-type domain-containing protein n=1 Tax=Durusdinium trenchii TaxID=1381693 RepID=A0ABP0IMF2_9DINO
MVFWATKGRGADAPHQTVVALVAGQDGTLMEKTLVARRETVETPQVKPGPGDNVSVPVNGCERDKVNGVAFASAANAGYSTAPKRDHVAPSETSMTLKVLGDRKGLECRLDLEYENEHAGESMMVHAKVSKFLLCEDQEMALVRTTYQDWVDGRWVDISSTVAYAETADAVVDAVLSDPNCGQTAGRSKTEGQNVDVKLGPFGSKGRICLTYFCPKMYTYGAMSRDADAGDMGAKLLAPLVVWLPCQAVGVAKGVTAINVRVEVPTGVDLLDTTADGAAYAQLLTDCRRKHETLLVVDKFDSGHDASVVQRSFKCAPPTSTGLLLWLSIDNPDHDFVDCADALGNLNLTAADKGKLTVFEPSASDAAALSVPMPGFGPAGNLYRAVLDVPPSPPRSKDAPPRCFAQLTISDRSGSTGCRVGPGNATCRDRFNELTVQRIQTRLKSVPGLVNAGVLGPQDRYVEAFFAFSHRLDSSEFLALRVGDIVAHGDRIVDQVEVKAFLDKITRITPGGGTDFVEAVRRVQQQSRDKILNTVPGGASAITSFINFDTDGGNHGGDRCYELLRNLVRDLNVQNGVVTGFGSWVSQDTASRVAEEIGTNPAMLALTVPAPGKEGLNRVFRQSFSAWVGALRAQALPITLAAGAVSFVDRRRPDNTFSINGVDVVAVKSLTGSGRPGFGAPDVSDETFTGTVLEGLLGGTKAELFLCSPLDPSALASRLGSETLEAVTWPESLGDTVLALRWLKVLTGKLPDAVLNTAFAVPHLANRMEDEVAFRFQLASPSGVTATVGRAKTRKDRPAIPQDKRPNVPLLRHREPPSLVPESGMRTFYFGAGKSGSGRGGRGGGRGGARHLMSYDRSAEASSRSGSSALRYDGCAQGGRAPMSRQASMGAAFGFGSSIPAPNGSASTSRAAPKKAKKAKAMSRRSGFAQSLRVECGSLDESDDSDDGMESGPSMPPHWIQVKEYFGNLELYPRESSNTAANFHFVKWSVDFSLDRLAYTCDQCERSLRTGDLRLHCIDCDDFDVHEGCISRCRHDASHRFRAVGQSHSGNAKVQPDEDPMVSQLLGFSASQAAQASQSDRDIVSLSAADMDRTRANALYTLQQFLLTMLHWWPLFRSAMNLNATTPAMLDEASVDRLLQVTRGQTSDTATAVRLSQDILAFLQKQSSFGAAQVHAAALPGAAAPGAGAFNARCS